MNLIETSHCCPRFAAGDLLGIGNLILLICFLIVLVLKAGQVGCHYMVPILVERSI